MKKTLNGSRVPIREVVICMKSRARKAVPAADSSVWPNRACRMAYINGTMKMPKSAPGSRQMKGLMPNRRMNRAMIEVPSSGCTVAYMCCRMAISQAFRG